MMATLQLSPNDPPDQNMVITGGGGGSVAKNGTFVTSVVSIRNNANHAEKHNIYTGLLSFNRAVISWQEITTLTRSYSQWLYPTYRPWSQAHCSKTTTPDPTAPGSWTHTYSNNISQGLTGRRAPQT